MTNPTSNFGWQMPTSTDLVTDLPADFETFGQAVDTSLADLKGGTSGQVLSKASNTDMDFTWVAQDDSNAIQNAIVDAKGDLIAASAADTPARLAVGANGETLVADSTTSTGLRYQGSMAAGRNGVINGGFDIWQRGTSFIGTGYNFTADRWTCARGGFAAGGTFSQQSAADANLPNIQYAVRMQRDSGNTGTQSMLYFSAFESANSIPFAGKTVTLSFYARKGANYSVTSSDMSTILYTGTGTDQNATIMAGWTGVASTTATQTLTTSWQRFSITATLGTGIKQIGVYFTSGAFTGTAGANDWLEVTGVQLEQGSVATAFTRTGGTIQGELDACKRYCQNINYSLSGKNVYNTLANGSATGATSARITLPLPAPMRVAPTSVTFTASSFVLDSVASAPTVTNVTINQGGTDTVLLTVDASAGTFTNKDPVIMYANNNSNANLILSAEL
jgi:hypothetical protein